MKAGGSKDRKGPKPHRAVSKLYNTFKLDHSATRLKVNLYTKLVVKHYNTLHH